MIGILLIGWLSLASFTKIYVFTYRTAGIAVKAEN
jgi:hypothetical protein